jgi:hypothetical protein
MFVALQMLGAGGLLGVAPSGRAFALDWTPRAIPGIPVAHVRKFLPCLFAYAWLHGSHDAVDGRLLRIRLPAVAALLGWLLLGETLAAAQIAGHGRDPGRNRARDRLLAAAAASPSPLNWSPANEENSAPSPSSQRSLVSQSRAVHRHRIVPIPLKLSRSARGSGGGRPCNTDAFSRSAERRPGHGLGQVSRISATTAIGDRHQRFILRLPSGQTVLIAHNIDVAPRVEGDQRRRHGVVSRRIRMERQGRRRATGPTTTHRAHMNPAG